MKILKAHRQRAKIKIGLQGPAGSGKTYSSLSLAKGLVDDWSKIVVIDTESGSSNLYAHLGPFRVLKLDHPFSPEKYIEAIQMAYKAGMEVIIIDSISHCWEYLLDYHANLQGNSFTNWARVTPRQQAFVNAILSTDVHLICTVRTKQDYVLNLKNGKYVPEKVGLKAIQRDGIDYELTLLFEIDSQHHCKVTKDRTGLFIDKNDYDGFKITEQTGKLIRDWTVQGKNLNAEILDCKTMEELNTLYAKYKPQSDDLLNMFKVQKKILQTKMMNSNGTSKVGGSSSIV